MSLFHGDITLETLGPVQMPMVTLILPDTYMPSFWAVGRGRHRLVILDVLNESFVFSPQWIVRSTSTNWRDYREHGPVF